MIESVLDRGEVVIELDATAGRWQVVAGSGVHTIREWTWGERWRLLDACTSGGRFDRPAFVGDLVRLLVDPVPAAEEAPLLAAIALRLLGVDADGRPGSLLAAEARLIAAWGVGPAELDPQPARRLDQHLDALPATPVAVAVPPHAAAGAMPAGWSSIEIVDG